VSAKAWKLSEMAVLTEGEEICRKSSRKTYRSSNESSKAWRQWCKDKSEESKLRWILMSSNYNGKDEIGTDS
jgi:hypothetical protein